MTQLTENQRAEVLHRLSSHEKWPKLDDEQKNLLARAALERARHRLAMQSVLPPDPFAKMRSGVYGEGALKLARKALQNPETGNVEVAVSPYATFEKQEGDWYEYSQPMPGMEQELQQLERKPLEVASVHRLVKGTMSMRLRVNPEMGETQILDPKGKEWIGVRTPATGPFGEMVPEAEEERRLAKLVESGQMTDVAKDVRLRKLKAERLGAQWNVPAESAEGMMLQGQIGLVEAAKTSWYRAIPGAGIGWDTGRLLKLQSAVRGLKLMGELDPDRDLTDTPEYRIVDNFLHARAEVGIREHSLGGLFAQGVLELPAFMVEFLATGGMGATGRQIGRRATLKALGKKASSKTVARTAGMVTEAAARTLHPASWARIAEGALQRSLPRDFKVSEHGQQTINMAGDSPLKALMMSVGDTTIEYFSEVTGAQFGRVGRRLAKVTPGVRRIAQKLARVPGMDAVMEQVQKVGWNGLTEEWLEERVGGALRGAFGLDESVKGQNLFVRIIEGASPGTGKEALAELLTLAVPMAGTHAMRKVQAPKTAKAAEAIEAVAGQHGLSKAAATEAVERARRAYGKGLKWESVLNRELARERMKTDEGAREWVQQHPLSAAEIAGKGTPSRADFRRAGLPAMEHAERVAVAKQVRGHLAEVEKEIKAFSETPELTPREQEIQAERGWVRRMAERQQAPAEPAKAARAESAHQFDKKEPFEKQEERTLPLKVGDTVEFLEASTDRTPKRGTVISNDPTAAQIKVTWPDAPPVYRVQPDGRRELIPDERYVPRWAVREASAAEAETPEATAGQQQPYGTVHTRPGTIGERQSLRRMAERETLRQMEGRRAQQEIARGREIDAALSPLDSHIDALDEQTRAAWQQSHQQEIAELGRAIEDNDLAAVRRMTRRLRAEFGDISKRKMLGRKEKKAIRQGMNAAARRLGIKPGGMSMERLAGKIREAREALGEQQERATLKEPASERLPKQPKPKVVKPKPVPQQAPVAATEQGVLSVADMPVKSSSSYGRWAVETEIAAPIGTGRTSSTKFFWNKKEAEQWIAETKKQLTQKASEKRVVTQEAYNEALDVLRRRRPLTGMDTDMLKAAVTVGAFHIENGLRDFAAWSSKMTAETGDWIKPHLQRIWDEAGGFIERGGKHVEAPAFIREVFNLREQDSVEGTYHGVKFSGRVISTRPANDYQSVVLHIDLAIPVTVHKEERDALSISYPSEYVTLHKTAQPAALPYDGKQPWEVPLVKLSRVMSDKDFVETLKSLVPKAQVESEMSRDTAIGRVSSLWRRTGKPDNVNTVDELVHRHTVEQALREGKSVPAEVLAEYPDLAKEYGKAALEPAATVEPAAEGVPIAPDSGIVYNVPRESLSLDPKRFQYKGETSSETGVGGQSLKDARKWKPERAGVVAVWRDPANGRDYIVNGHHRFALAAALGIESLNVMYLDTKDAKGARVAGALINIAEDQGSAIDAARIFRDGDYTAEDLQNEGISLKRRLAQEGLALARLTDPLFHMVATSKIPVSHGVAIGENLPNKDLQVQLWDILQKSKRSQTVGMITELAKEVAFAWEHRETSGTEENTRDLFGGTHDEVLVADRAAVSDRILRKLRQDIVIFTPLLNERKAERLKEAGTTVDTKVAAEIVKEANDLFNYYEDERRKLSPIRKLLNDAALRVHKGESLADVVEDMYGQVRDELKGIIEKPLEGFASAKDTKEVSGRQGEVGESGAPDQSAQGPVASQKRVFTEKRYSEAKDKLKDFFGGNTLLTGLPVDILKELVVVGGYHVENGARQFAAWSQKMVAELGEKVKPYLHEIWDAVQQEAKSEPRIYGGGRGQGPRPATTGPGTPDAGAARGGSDAVRRPGLRVAGTEHLPTPRKIVADDRYPARELDQDQTLAVNIVLDGFSRGNRGAMLAEGTGVGKTREILAIADHMREQSDKPILIITRNATLIESYKRDAAALGMSLDGIEFGTYTKMAMENAGQGDYYLKIFDEAQDLKNVHSKRSTAGLNVTAEHVLYATATPLDRPTGAAYFLAGVLDRPLAEIQERLGFRVIEDVLEDGKQVRYAVPLPGQSWQRIMDNLVQMRNEAVGNYAFVRREYPFFGDLTEHKIQLSQERVDEQAQIDSYWQSRIADASSPRMRGFLEGQRLGEMSRWVESTKADAVYERIREELDAGRSVVVVSEYVNESAIKGFGGATVTGILTQLSERLDADGIGFAKIFGSGSKTREVDRFQQGKVRVALATPQSGGVGINLDDVVGNAPRTMLITTANWSGDMFDQTLGRISRRNTKSPALVEYISAPRSFSDVRRSEVLTRKMQALRRIQAGEDPDVSRGFEPGDLGREKRAKDKPPAPPSGGIPSDVTIEPYSERSFVVRGSTDQIAQQLEQMHGNYNERLRGGAGWVFSVRHRGVVEQFLGGGQATQQERMPGGAAMASLSRMDPFDKPAETGEQPRKRKPVLPAETAANMPASEFVDGVLQAVAPALRKGTAKSTMQSLRKRLAEAAQRMEAAQHKLEGLWKFFQKFSPQENIDFLDRLERGQEQPTPSMQASAEVIRGLLDRYRERIQEHGRLLDDYYEDYFPHIFQDPQKAKQMLRSLMGERKLTPSGFLMQREHEFIREALEAGLELVSDNPVDLVVLRLHQINKWLAGKDFLRDIKQTGTARFIPAAWNKNFLPYGWKRVDDPALIVQAKPEVTIEEAYDQLLVDQLCAIARGLGIKNERVAKLRSSRTWGLAHGDSKIQTRFAGPVSVLIHELGHTVALRFKMWDWLALDGPHVQGRLNTKGPHKGMPNAKDSARLRKLLQKEWRALADLRHEEQEAGPGFQKYVRKQAEKEAVVFEAYLAAPDKFREVAPTLYFAFQEFLEKTPELAPMLNLNRSVVLGSREQSVELKGVLELGFWALPNESATIVEHYLSPGLSGHENAAVRKGYGVARVLANAMVQAELAFSGFHALNVTSDSTSSQAAIGLRRILMGDIKGGLRDIVMAPFAGVSSLVTGDTVLRAMRNHEALEDIKDPWMAETIRRIIDAGGRASMDPMYNNRAYKALQKTFRDIQYTTQTGKRGLKAALLLPQAVGTALEVASKPIMEWQVPRLKIGVFVHEAGFVLQQARKYEWSQERVEQELGKAWDSVDNRMGQLVYDNLGWSRLLRNASMLIFRSVGWNLGSWREFGGGIVETLTLPLRLGKNESLITRKMAYTFASGVNYAIQGAVIGFLVSGRWPWDWDDEETSLKDCFFPRTGYFNADGSPERLVFPNYAKEWYAWGTRPVVTLGHKLNPLWGRAVDLARNEDFYGTEIRDKDDPATKQALDVLKYTAESFVPFTVRNLHRFRAAGESVPRATVTALTGITAAPAYVARSDAQAALYAFTRDSMPRGTRTKAQAEKAEVRRDAITLLRSGKTVGADARGKFTDDEWARIERQGKLPAFTARFESLPLRQALNVYMLANKAERAKSYPLLLRKYFSGVTGKRLQPEEQQAFALLTASAPEIPSDDWATEAIGKLLLDLTAESSSPYDTERMAIMRSLRSSGLTTQALRDAMGTVYTGSRRIYTSTMKMTAYGERHRRLARMLNTAE